MSEKKAGALLIDAPSERATGPSVQCAAGAGDDASSDASPVGAAKAERDDEDETDTASDARSREVLEGSLMANSALKVVL